MATENHGSLDAELGAMTLVTKALSKLDDDVRARVLRWAVDRFGRGEVRAPKGGLVGSGTTTGMKSDEADLDQDAYTEYHDLVDAAEPENGLERILVTAYWFQVVEGLETFESYQVNREMKHLGHPSANITRDLGRLIKRKPKLVLQVKKTGTTKQARKRYRLTREGIKAVEEMLRGKSEEAA